MFPNPPFNGFTWPITQHMGVIRADNLYHILWAASAYGFTDDPSLNITDYVIANGLFTPNIRSDSGQPDAWRDYQQILSELGLIVSTQVSSKISLTPIGLAFLDGSLSFSEVMSLQAFRYQYPNGHKLTITSSLRSMLAGSVLANIRTLPELQDICGVRIRPAVLIWDIVRGLDSKGEEPFVSVDEIQRVLMRCSTHNESDACLDAIIAGRKSGVQLPRMERGRRNAQDWVKFLSYTPFFSLKAGSSGGVSISDYGREHYLLLDQLCTLLRSPESFWSPGGNGAARRVNWYIIFGSIDAGLLFPMDMAARVGSTQDIEFPGGSLGDEVRGMEGDSARSIKLRDFDPAALGGLNQELGSGTTIDSSYDSGLATRSHRLHDEMVMLIGNICHSNGAEVFDDPNSVDLLVVYEGQEFIVEVKSVTASNLVNRLRYALGQVLHYDYIRAQENTYHRRKVVGLAAVIPVNAWYKSFITDHLDMDLLSLQGLTLRIDSTSVISQRLFATA